MRGNLKNKTGQISVFLICAAILASIGFGAGPAQAVTFTGAVSANTALTVSDTLRSPNGNYRFVVQSDGNAVVYSGNTAIWDTNTVGSGSANTLTAQSDGNVVLRTSSGAVAWQSQTYGHGTGSQLALGNDGNLVFTGTNGVALWASINPTGYLTPGQSITAGQVVRSDYQSGYYLTMQQDGNLVLMRNQTAVWSTQTSSTVNLPHRAILQPDGLFVVYDSANNPLWHVGAWNSSPSNFAVQPDGNLVLYITDGSHSWARVEPPPPPAPAQTAQSLAAQLVDAKNRGNLTFTDDVLYTRQVRDVANGTASAMCTDDIQIYQIMLLLVNRYGSLRVSDLQRPCYGSTDTCSYSAHCAVPGLAIDIVSAGGQPTRGNDARSVSVLNFLDQHVSAGTRTGQGGCAGGYPGRGNWANITQGYDDPCNHVHIDVPANGSVRM